MIDYLLKVDGREYTRLQLKEVFEKIVENNQLPVGKEAWKYPIQTEIKREEKDIARDAVYFYVGEYPKIVNLNKTLLFSRGYNAIHLC